MSVLVLGTEVELGRGRGRVRGGKEGLGGWMSVGLSGLDQERGMRGRDVFGGVEFGVPVGWFR